MYKPEKFYKFRHKQTGQVIRVSGICKHLLDELTMDFNYQEILGESTHPEHKTAYHHRYGTPNHGTSHPVTT